MKPLEGKCVENSELIHLDNSESLVGCKKKKQNTKYDEIIGKFRVESLSKFLECLPKNYFSHLIEN